MTDGWLGQPNPLAPLRPADALRATLVRALPPEIHQHGHDRRAEEQPEQAPSFDAPEYAEENPQERQPGRAADDDRANQMVGDRDHAKAEQHDDDRRNHRAVINQHDRGYRKHHESAERNDGADRRRDAQHRRMRHARDVIGDRQHEAFAEPYEHQTIDSAVDRRNNLKPRRLPRGPNSRVLKNSSAL